MTFTQQLILGVVQGAAPVLLVIAGGKWLLDAYEVKRKRSELQLGLIRFVREQQYAALRDLYENFAELMRLYRLINLPDTSLENDAIRGPLLEQAALTEGKIDATILRVASEFAHDNREELATILAELRQSVQLWRECLRMKVSLPFTSSDQADYVRFKKSFSDVTTYLAGRIYDRLDTPELARKESLELLMEVFGNQHEWHGSRP